MSIEYNNNVHSQKFGEDSTISSHRQSNIREHLNIENSDLNLFLRAAFKFSLEGPQNYFRKADISDFNPSLGLESCPSGWFNMDKACYKVHNESLPWLEARKTCLENGADLLTLKTKPEEASIRSYLKSLNKHLSYYWLGK